jgi:hypothetical protein
MSGTLALPRRREAFSEQSLSRCFAFVAVVFAIDNLRDRPQQSAKVGIRPSSPKAFYFPFVGCGKLGPIREPRMLSSVWAIGTLATGAGGLSVNLPNAVQNNHWPTEAGVRLSLGQYKALVLAPQVCYTRH